jgi:hypothetical protein
VGITNSHLFLVVVIVLGACQSADPRPALGTLIPGKGLVIGSAEVGSSRWAVEMRTTETEVCTAWELYGEPPAVDFVGGGCATDLLDLLRPDRASPVFVQLSGGEQTRDVTFIEGVAGIGLARVVLDYGAGQIDPPLVDLAPISLRGLAFAVAMPGRIEINAVTGFDAEGRQVLSQIL